MNTANSNDNKSWYLVYTKPRGESTAAENLSRQNYQTYLPLFRKTRIKNAQAKTIIEPLFPRYVFIELSIETDNWSPIRSTIGVSKIVNFGFTPAKVPDSLIAILKENENLDGLYEFTEKKLVKGESVEILSGPMMGYSGIFNQYATKNRVSILLNLLGKETSVLLSSIHVQSNDYSLSV
ncbi:MAG: transcription/translation regulatory transformer protein RfaH [Gammaproteobacteria bacterium]